MKPAVMLKPFPWRPRLKPLWLRGVRCECLSEEQKNGQENWSWWREGVCKRCKRLAGKSDHYLYYPLIILQEKVGAEIMLCILNIIVSTLLEHSRVHKHFWRHAMSILAIHIVKSVVPHVQENQEFGTGLIPSANHLQHFVYYSVPKYSLHFQI